MYLLDTVRMRLFCSRVIDGASWKNNHPSEFSQGIGVRFSTWVTNTIRIFILHLLSMPCMLTALHEQGLLSVSDGLSTLAEVKKDISSDCLLQGFPLGTLDPTKHFNWLCRHQKKIDTNCGARMSLKRFRVQL